jgi:anti-anti-sigma factor
MDISQNQTGGIDVVKAVGRIDSNTAPKVREAFETITKAGRFKIVFDMGEIEYLSSSGVWVLLDTQKTCKRKKRGELIIANVNENIEYTLDLAGVKHFIKIKEDVDGAVASF